jgi:hypothetical protein
MSTWKACGSEAPLPLEPAGGLRLREAVHARLGKRVSARVAGVDDLAGERHQCPHVIDVVVGEVGVDRLLVAHRVEPARRDDHGLGLAVDLVGHVAAECATAATSSSSPATFR